MFPPLARGKISASLMTDGVRGLVLLENITLGSPSYGRQAIAVYGPGCAHRTMMAIADAWKGAAERDRLQPIAWCVRDDVELPELQKGQA